MVPSSIMIEKKPVRTAVATVTYNTRTGTCLLGSRSSLWIFCRKNPSPVHIEDFRYQPSRTMDLKENFLLTKIRRILGPGSRPNWTLLADDSPV
jgi:hypothetical protein